MSVDLTQTWTMLGWLEQAVDAQGIEACLLAYAARFGLTALFAGWVPALDTTARDIPSKILFQKFPTEWAARYNDRDYVFRDPVVQRLQSDRNLFSWADAYSSCRSSSDVKLIRGEASEFGLVDGLVVPIQSVDGAHAAFSFGGERPQISGEDAAALAFVTNFAAGHLLTIVSRRKVGEHTRLTPREVDCLIWSAEGKTDWEISKILGISRSTVLKHIASAREKLGAMNKTHAVAMALRSKLVR